MFWNVTPCIPVVHGHFGGPLANYKDGIFPFTFFSVAIKSIYFKCSLFTQRFIALNTA
jgi:hypothetical protein